MIDKTQDPALDLCRAEFEAWLKEKTKDRDQSYLLDRKENGEYRFNPAWTDWRVWQAAWNRRPSPASPAPKGLDLEHPAPGLDPHPGKPGRWICAGCSVDVFPPNYYCPTRGCNMTRPAPAPGADTREAGREIAMDVCRSLDAFQRHYQANTHDKYPGNEYWGQRLFSIIESARAALAPVASPPAPAGFDALKKQIGLELTAITAQRQEICRAFLAKYGCEPDALEQVIQHLPDGTVWFVRPRPAAPLAPDPLPAALGSPLDVLGAAIERDIGMQLNGDTITDRYVALKGVVHEILGRAPTPPESGAPAPNLREAGKVLDLLKRLEWVRAEDSLTHCPECGSIFYEELRHNPGCELEAVRRALDERSESGEQREPAPIPSQIEPGEKDQDGSGKPVAGAGAPSEGDNA